MATVREFVRRSYRPVSANSPNVPIPNGNLSDGIELLNNLISAYSANGLMLTVPREETIVLTPGTTEVEFGTVASGRDRLANLENAWLVLANVTYPLNPVSESQFYSSYKFDPLLGLPIYCIFIPRTDHTILRLYPGASQGYTLHVYGKFQKSMLTANDTMDDYAPYFLRFLQLALSREIALNLSRPGAWGEINQQMYLEAKKDMEAVSNVNLDISSVNENQLNGAFRVRAGI